MKHVTTISRNYMTRALSITLILGLLLSSLAFSPNLSEIFNTNVWADTDGEWLGPNCTADWYYFHEGDDAYSIGTAEELGGLATLVNYGMENFEGKTVKLTANIDLGEHYWIPIGLGDDDGETRNVFKGIFDGQGYTIDGMLVGKSVYETADYQYAGLFGYIENATVQNINIGNKSQIYASNISGEICGYAHNSTINDCSNAGMVFSNSEENDAFTGGICGQASNSVLSKCKNSGIINSNSGVADKSSYAGGICGDISSSTVSNCSNSGMVLSNAIDKSSCAGGICGKASNANIDDCSNDASSFASKYIGGICALAESTTINNTYYKKGTAAKGIGNQQDQTGTAALSDINQKENTQEISKNINASIQTYWINEGNYDTSWYDANATEFEISNASQLAGLAVLVNNTTDNFDGKVIKLTTDIDLADYYWVPIGLGDNNNNDDSEATNIFKGSFDGQTYTIDGMLIGESEDEPADYSYAGLFGDASGGTIENVNIGKNSQIYNKSGMAGSICGICESATINNCSNSGDISKSEHAGGICGYALKSIISNCSNNGSISTECFAGGICGDALKSTISACCNRGKIFALDYSGGICGLIFDDTEISNCVNIECVLALLGAGGICGMADHYVTIRDCSNNGNVSSQLGAYGGVCAAAVNTTTISNTYYRKDTAAKGIGNQDDNNQEGTTVLSEEETENKIKEFLGQKVLAGNIDTNVNTDNYSGWKQIEGDYYYFDNGTMLTDSWCTDSSGSTYWYVDSDGKMIEDIYAIKDPKADPDADPYIYYINNDLANGNVVIGGIAWEFNNGKSVESMSNAWGISNAA